MAFNGAVSVGTSSTPVINVTSGPAPMLIVLTNNSDTTIFLSLGGEAAAMNSGIMLTASSAFTIDTRNVCVTKINAITSVAGKQLCVSYV